MSGGIRINVKGYIRKRGTLAVDDKKAAAEENASPSPAEASSLLRQSSSRLLRQSSSPLLRRQNSSAPKVTTSSPTFYLDCIEMPDQNKLSGGGMDPGLPDDIIRRHSELQSASQPRATLVSESEMMQLCHCATEIFLTQPNVLDLKSPIHIIGGPFTELLTDIKAWGLGKKKNTPSDNYLAHVFLGDFMDFGTGSSDTMCLLLAYKIKYPNNVFLLRGDHAGNTNQRCGFYDRRHNVRLWDVFNDCFNCIPVAAIVDNIFLKKPTYKTGNYINHNRHPLDSFRIY